MINLWQRSATMPMLEQTVQFAEKRHLLLAGNLANLDTPDYKTRDLSVTDFRQSMSEVADAKKNALRLNHPSAAASAERVYNASLEKARDVSKQILYHDGSDVSMEQQITDINKNQTMHQMAISLLNNQFRLMQMAISQNVNV